MESEWLLVDLGNSRLKWAWLSRGLRSQAQAVKYEKDRLGPLLESLWEQRPEQILICSVTAEATNKQISDWCQNHWSLEPQWFRSSASYLGISNAYQEPGRLGNDRWLGLIVARHLFAGPLAVVDAGTALTIDLLDANNQHQGGWILPGIGLQQRALYQKTDINTDIQPDQKPVPQTVPGHNTRDCIANGSLAAALGAIHLIGQQLAAQPAWQGLKWVLTGGEASIIAPDFPWPCELQPELLLDGLALVALNSR